jgi:ankyrin repeat protein
LNVDIALLLLNAGADPTHAESNQWEPIHNATRLGVTIVLQLLLQKVNPTATTNNGLHPIHVAAHYGIIGSLNLLLKDQRVTTRSKNEAYQISKMKQYKHFAEILYNHLHPEKRKKERTCLDPLHIAANNCDLEYIKHIFHLHSISKTPNEIDLNVRDSKGCTPLHYAIRAGSYMFARMLIEHDHIDILAENKKGEQPIHFAAKFGRNCIIKHLLMSSKVNPDVRCNRYVFLNFGKAQPIVLAARNFRESEVKELLKTGRISSYSKLSAKRAALSSILKLTWHASEDDAYNNDMLWDQMRHSFVEIWYAIVDCITF